MPRAHLWPLLLAASLLHAYASAQSTANVLVLMLDDVGPEWLGCYGRMANPPSTPNMNQLCANGVRFDRAYANPICAPSRACLQTGRHAFRSGIVSSLLPTSPGLQDAEVLLPEAIAGSGRGAAMVGKWHLGCRHGDATPNVQGWPFFDGNLDGAIADYTSWSRVTNGQVANCTQYATTAEVDSGLAWIAAQQQPWLLLMSFHAPHSPYHEPPAGLHQQNLSGLSPTTTPEPFFRAMLEALDTEIGRLLQGLGPALANTNVILVGDNGTPRELLAQGANPNRAKGSLYETGISIPLVVSGPAVVQGGRTTNELTSIVDLFPTVLQLCGVDPAVALPNLLLDGVSLLPLLQNQPGAVRTHVYCEVVGTGFGDGAMLRNDTTKLIRFVDSYGTLPHEELYDLAGDPGETTNLIGIGQPPNQVASHQQLTNELWNLRRAGFALQYGEGCSGQDGAIRQRTYTRPRLGDGYSVLITNPQQSAAPTLSIGVFGWSSEFSGSTALPWDMASLGMPGCQLLCDAGLVLHFGATNEVYYVGIPNDPFFLQAQFHLQAFALDQTANALGLAASPALRVIVGE